MRRFRFLLAIVAPAFVRAVLRAQSTLATQQVTLGNATVPLTGPWKFHIGDNMAWAQPGFDDSAWGTMDLTPPPGSYDPILGSSGYLPGWTARGYKGYSGYAWYRLRINIQDGQSALALKMPDDCRRRLSGVCEWPAHRRVWPVHRARRHPYVTQPRAFPLPANLRSGPVTLAIRMWMNPSTPLVDPDAGGLHGPPVLGHASAIAGLLQLDWDAIDRQIYSSFFRDGDSAAGPAGGFRSFLAGPHRTGVSLAGTHLRGHPVRSTC